MTAIYEPATRRFQGIPGLEILSSGRMFAVYYANTLAGEGPGNYVVLAMSDDHGQSWREINVVAPVDPATERAFDPVIWLDPLGRLWLIWNQSLSNKLWDPFDGIGGVWASICDQPDADPLRWSEARRIADGIQMCKPTVLSDGRWVFPTAVWSIFADKLTDETRKIAFSNLTVTDDGGQTFALIKGPDVPQRVFDEHMLIEHADKHWTVYVRTRYGIGQSTSTDGGKTWSPGVDSRLGGPNSRVAIRRLKSGNLLLINNDTPQLLPGEERGGTDRKDMMAWLSTDDGQSWRGRLLLDERNGVSYPDIVETNDGFIHVVYDHDRQKHGQILLARFTETDVLKGDFVTPGGYTRLVAAAFPGRAD